MLGAERKGGRGQIMEAVEKRKGDFRGQDDIHNYSKNTSSLPGRPLQVSVKLS